MCYQVRSWMLANTEGGSIPVAFDVAGGSITGSDNRSSRGFY